MLIFFYSNPFPLAISSLDYDGDAQGTHFDHFGLPWGSQGSNLEPLGSQGYVPFCASARDRKRHLFFCCLGVRWGQPRNTLRSIWAPMGLPQLEFGALGLPRPYDFFRFRQVFIYVSNKSDHSYLRSLLSPNISRS